MNEPVVKLVISMHGEQRLLERFGAHKEKHQKVVHKAWRSQEPMTNRKMHFKPYQDMFRDYRKEDIIKQYMGRIFVFRPLGNEAYILLTVMN